MGDMIRISRGDFDGIEPKVLARIKIVSRGVV
jgi:hypothetical protein